jgi:hypothetical protein
MNNLPKLIEVPRCCCQSMQFEADAPQYFGWLYRCAKCRKSTVVFNLSLFGK